MRKGPLTSKFHILRFNFELLLLYFLFQKIQSFCLYYTHYGFYQHFCNVCAKILATFTFGKILTSRFVKHVVNFKNHYLYQTLWNIKHIYLFSYSIRNLIKSLKMSKKSHNMCNKHSPYACTTSKINGIVSELAFHSSVGAGQVTSLAGSLTKGLTCRYKYPCLSDERPPIK